ncbi:MAG: hypothetical protein E7082_03625 [Bacteroidales bacterium]|nr:hypothetical protein [Bacteroidales bacterium]
MKSKIFAIAIIAIPMLCSCASKKTIEPLPLNNIILASPTPKAIAYKMSGQASADNVPIQVDNQGNIISFPDPSDLKNAEPIQLKGGYLLDRRGVNTNTRFLSYTYKEYSSLNVPPSITELKASIIPDARVSEIIQLPVTISQAVADLNAINAMLP